nr:TonB-dependent receptor [Stakelama sediminis]
MSLKNPVNHGGIFGQNYGLGNPFPQIAIQEYNVETQNFGAETGQAGSAVITAITKTGGNHFHGSAFIDFQPNSFITQPYFDKKNGVPKPAYNRKQFGGELGGPIIPDKLTFYVAGEGTIENLPGTQGIVTNVPTSVSNLVNISHNKDFKQGLYFGKLTWFATDSDTVNLEAFIRRENNLSDIDSNAASTHGRTILTHEDRFQFNWKHHAGNFVNELNIAYDKQTQETPPVGTGPEYNLDNSYYSASDCTADEIANTNCQVMNPDFSARAQLGAHYFYQGDAVKSFTLKNDSTLISGNHTIKFGGQFALLNMSRTVNNAFDGRYFYYNPGASGTFDPLTDQPYGAKINIQSSPTVSAKDYQIGAYVQDEWRPDDHWTLNYGLRWDLETNANNNDYVTPTAVADALRNYPGWAANGIDPNNYISTGSNRKPEWGAIQPRFGVSYDVHGDGSLVIFGGVGRYFDRSLFIEGVLETLTNSSKIANVYFCNNGGASQGAGNGLTPADCAQWNSAYLNPANLRALAKTQGTNGGDVWVLNNKTRLPFSDQLDFGIRKRFGQIRTSITYSHISSHNIFQYVRANYFTNGWYTRYLQTDAAGNVIGCTPGGDAWIQDNISDVTYAACPAGGGQLQGYQGKLDRGMSDGKAQYDAFYIKAEKPFTDNSIWGFTTTLTLQFAKSNVAQALSSDEFYNGSRQDAYGWNYVGGVEKWHLVTTGIYRAPLGLTLSGTLDLSSGPSFGNVVFGDTPDSASAYGNFGGVFYPKPFIAYKRLDLKIAKTFTMPWGDGDHKLTADFQVFNVFNWLNRTYSAWGAGSGDPAPLIENGQVYNDSRRFQAGIRYKF